MSKHAEMVTALVKPGAQVVWDLSPLDGHLLHMAVGVSGEAGELLDAIKKKTIYQKELDRANVIEELGDLEFYMEGLRQGLKIMRDETLEANIAKLTKRYPAFKFSTSDAITRADKI